MRAASSPACTLHGAALLTGLGLAFSFGSLAAAAYLVHHLVRQNCRAGAKPRWPSLLRSAACSVIMAGPALATADLVADLLPGAVGRVLAMLAATFVGAGIYFAAQAACAHRRWAGWPAGCAASGRASLGTAPQWPAAPHRRCWPFLRRRRVDVVLLVTLPGCRRAGRCQAQVRGDPDRWSFPRRTGRGRPAAAAYLLIFLTPLIVGVNAGSHVPLVRPNEALMALFGAAIAVRWLARVRTGDRQWPQLDSVDLSLIALCLTSSVLPLIMMMAGSRAITTDDILYSMVLWKLLAEYVIVRSVITTREQAMRCLGC